jgi:hypothetical protein
MTVPREYEDSARFYELLTVQCTMSRHCTIKFCNLIA